MLVQIECANKSTPMRFLNETNASSANARIALYKQLDRSVLCFVKERGKTWIRAKKEDEKLSRKEYERADMIEFVRVLRWLFYMTT